MADLAALLEKEASAEVEAVLGDARERASEIVAQAESEAETLIAQRERQAKAARDAALVRARSSAQLEASAMRLTAQQVAIESVFDDAAERLDALTADSKRYAPVLAVLVDEAIAGLRAAPDAVVVHPDDEEALREALQASRLPSSVARTDPSVRGGVRVVAGRIAVENTLPARLDALRDELASEVAAALTSKDA